MTQSLWSKAAFSSSGICLDGCTADPSPLNLDASGGSVPANEVSRDTRGLLDRPLYSTGNAGSRSTCPSQFELDPSRESGAAHLARIPPPGSYDHHGWSMKSGHRAKRARVENIIKGMTCTDVTSHFNQTDCMQEDGGIQELLHQTRRERIGSVSPGQNQATRKEPESQHRCLSHTEGETDRRWADSPEASPNDAFPDSCTEFESRKSQGWKKVELMNYFQSKPDRIKLMADILKYELSRAVSRSVDSIFKSVPLLQTPPRDAENPETGVPLQAAVHRENRLGFPCCGAAEIPDVQTEALSLVIQKPGLERPDSFVLEPRSAAPKSSSSLCHESALHGEGSLERSRSTEHRLALRCWRDGGSEAGRSKQDARWNPFKVKSKVNSAPGRSPERHAGPMDPVLLGSLSLPHVKLEADNLEKNNLYMLNECLTTNHLKKAKLMFFYTRYPSSLVLRMCFHDVQFTRCITSQLIKWFSNFREFYYIQMEKFARNALAEGVADVRDLTVDRESELFRALNTHYNKANDFQVPERFLEVAEITLREFYVAISLGKDHDPSWKKAIYKVICKLDSDVPAEFKRHYSG
ncbi:prospero homeobox protein 2-like [Kryptolebias marmoratus]|uniref:prospero homeobox protein 2-like n=1 Tax=Kryptolebias marmoratus TaxID=37003 RepID=UPI000D530671|nr:prospero homeobox protein 2-like [Kryptolebias marmoratus]